MKRLIYLTSLIMMLVISSSCTNSNNRFNSEEIDRIKIELIEKSPMPSGISYSFRLKNLSNQTIAQNSVYISYPIKTSNGAKGNDMKVEMKNNKLNIKPNNNLILNAFVPNEDIEGIRTLDIENFNIEIKGYIGKVSEETHFEKSGAIDFFK